VVVGVVVGGAGVVVRVAVGDAGGSGAAHAASVVNMITVASTHISLPRLNFDLFIFLTLH